MLPRRKLAPQAHPSPIPGLAQRLRDLTQIRLPSWSVCTNRGAKAPKTTFSNTEDKMQRRIPFPYFVLLSFALVVPAYAAAPPQAVQGRKTLYQRLGGYDALAAVSDDFLGRQI